MAPQFIPSWLAAFMDNLPGVLSIIFGLYWVLTSRQQAKGLADWGRERGYDKHADELERRYRYIVPVVGLVLIGLGIKVLVGG